jgi:type I restriction enzyme, S subunit
MKVLNSAVGNMIGSSGRQRVPASILRTYEIDKIDTSLMVQFNELIKPFFERIRQNTSETQTLKQLRDSLLPKLLRGDIVV